MRNNYIVFFAFLSFGVYAQKNQNKIAYYNTTKDEAVLKFMDSYGLDANTTFLPKKETVDISGMSHQRHQQYFNGLKVEYGTLITHSRNGIVESINGELYNAKGLKIEPSITPAQGLILAKKNVNAEKYLWEEAESAKELNYEMPKGELVIFPKINSDEIRLAYKYDIFAISPTSRNEVYVDAHTGEILFKNPIIKHLSLESENSNIKVNKVTDQFEQMVATTVPTRYSGNQSIETTFNAGLNKYVLQDNTRGNGIVTYNAGGTNSHGTTHFTDTNNTWNTGNYATNSSTKDNAALDAHWGAEKTYDFWKNIFNRNSFDDNNAQIRSYVHYDDAPATPGPWANAHWNGSTMDYGESSTKPFTGLDICGHEIGHAVCSYTADLVYANQSGAMNEGFSDIWGACIEHYGRTGSMGGTINSNVWIVGEDITTGGLRSMSNPNSKGDPNCYNGTNWYTGTGDNGGVHKNSGVLNYWFYLLTVGGSGTNNAPIAERDTYSVTGIGMLKAAQIAYFTERDYLTPNSTYFDARDLSSTVAKNLFGCGSAEHIATVNSWFAVNLGSKYTDLDLNLSSITGDSNVACGASHSFSFDLQNFNSPSISSAAITYSVDGGTQISIPWTGSALSVCTNPIQNYTVALGTLSRGTHVILVTVTLAGDTYLNNNSKTAYVTVNDNGVISATNTFENTSDALVSIDQNGKTNSVWERGNVNKTLLTNAVDGSKVYATKLTGNYPDKTTSYLVSQCYNLSNVVNPSVSFDMAFDLESNWDIIYFEYSTDSGVSWNVLGTSADSNWYNSSRLPNGTDCFNCIGKQWTGDYATAPSGGTGVNGNKRNYSHSLTSLGNPSNAIFRFTFVSDDAANQEGVIIDNFVVQGTLSREENSFEQFVVYPNPSKGKFNVVLSSSDEVKVEVFDIRGRSVYNKSYQSDGAVFNKEIDLNTISSGVYILNIESAGKKEARRIIIE
ncbi:M4 family metallopeptidase [Flavobacterium terrae]|uniref:Por secretion system C-terminal sorting domain-containing protein n=1 Tax=Flavobacterium terrae TaxID=415425 RepID=A0A1M6GFC7_9FLAO|nr:M4 family metallopeptidase [Flavobacterium terrae]SHJ08581.1 Por secretion system C-terminal sorting domain-containing protein [Flavobacterium terrae]